MTLRESELSRSRRATRSHQKQLRRQQQRRALDQGPLALSDARVLTFAEWCALGGFSQRTGRRILSSGNGPIITQLSPKRIGITIGNDKAWKASRERSA